MQTGQLPVIPGPRTPHKTKIGQLSYIHLFSAYSRPAREAGASRHAGHCALFVLPLEGGKDILEGCIHIPGGSVIDLGVNHGLVDLSGDLVGLRQ